MSYSFPPNFSKALTQEQLDILFNGEYIDFRNPDEIIKSLSNVTANDAKLYYEQIYKEDK